MKRPCPVCGASGGVYLHHCEFTDATRQELTLCMACGGVYASESPPADYGDCSIYARPEAIGSGETPLEREKDTATASLFASLFPDRTRSVLDVGCARGGLLTALYAAGYRLAVGLDPSKECVAACIRKGLAAMHGNVEDALSQPNTLYGTFDVIILSHVLEHVWDVPKALRAVLARLNTGGSLYVEVPDAMRYGDHLVTPFGDINREHISHFSLNLVREALRRGGFHPVVSGERVIIQEARPYPAIYVVATTAPSRNRWVYPDPDLGGYIASYIRESKFRLAAIDHALLPRLDGQEIVMWGFGEFAQRLFQTTALRSAKIVAIVDQNPRKWRLRYGEIPVRSPAVLSVLPRETPILIASIVNAERICADIAKAGYSNPVIRIP